MLPPSFTTVIAARNARDEIGGTIESLLDAPEGVAVNVVLVTNGPRDGAHDVVESFRHRIEATGGTLVLEHLDEQGKARAIRHGLTFAPPGPVMLLDTRVRMEPGSIGPLLEAAGQDHLDVVSAELVYQPSPSRIVTAFSRAYAATPYGRSRDAKGTCVMIAADHRAGLEALPDLAADDRYLIASTAADRRTMVDGARVKYFFPDDARSLVNQQVRWVRANAAFDAAFGDYERNAHEENRRPYFGPNPPGVLAIGVYGVVMVAARAIAALRPADRTAW